MNNKENNEFKEKTKNSFLILCVISLADTILRIPYLVESANRGGLENVFLVIGIIACVMALLTVVLNKQNKLAGILGIITGILMFLSGSIIGNILGILLLIDSIRQLRK